MHFRGYENSQNPLQFVFNSYIKPQHFQRYYSKFDLLKNVRIKNTQLMILFNEMVKKQLIFTLWLLAGLRLGELLQSHPPLKKSDYRLYFIRWKRSFLMIAINHAPIRTTRSHINNHTQTHTCTTPQKTINMLKVLNQTIQTQTCGSETCNKSLSNVTSFCLLTHNIWHNKWEICDNILTQ